MAHHTLKIKSMYLSRIIDGQKTFEIRDNSDRDFQVGDTFTLVEQIEPIEGSIHQNGEPQRCLDSEITYVTDYEQKENYVVFGFKNVTPF